MVDFFNPGDDVQDYFFQLFCNRLKNWKTNYKSSDDLFEMK